MVAEIQNLVSALRQISLAANLFDKTIPTEDRAIFQLAVLPVHSDNKVRVFNE